jgi:hypothetical protein
MRTTATNAWASRIAAFRLAGCDTGSIFADDFEQGNPSAWSAVVP